MKIKKVTAFLAVLATGMLLTACSAGQDQNDNTENTTEEQTESTVENTEDMEAGEDSADSESGTDSSSAVGSDAAGSEADRDTAESSTAEASSGSDASTFDTGYADGILDTSDMFTDRDLEQTADTLEDAEYLTVADGQTFDITGAGVYVISGNAKNCTIRVEADNEDKVQLVLDNATITNEDFPAIYVVSADKCFVTTTATENSLSVTGTFTADGDTNTDAVIYSKDDLVLNGTGTLNIESAAGNGISGKDDLKITGGTYQITSAEDSIEANDSIRICGGTFSISSSKDGLHSENEDDDTQGYIYIADGTFEIAAASDGLQGTTVVQIDGGTYHITASEGIEATYVQINDGTISIDASDDGINASAKSSAYSTPTVEFNGGSVTIVMGQGDTDAVDANGSIYVNGGTIDITATVSSFDYDGTAEFNGGTIIINGSEVTEIPEPTMGGGGFGRGGFDGGNDMEGGKGFGGDGFGGRRR